MSAIAFAMVGCIAHFSLSAFEGKSHQTVARLAHRTFVLSFLLTFAVATLGVIVASYRSF